MPPVAAPIEREPAEEDQSPSQEGVLPRHLPLNAMAGVFGPAGQAAYAISDVFSDFKVSTIISEFAAGLQQWMLDGATSPEDPNYPGNRKGGSGSSNWIQDYYEAMQLADAHRELWLQGGQDIGGVRISNKELAELADRLATDDKFRQRMKDAVANWNDPRYDTDEKREQFLTSYQRFIYLDQIGEPARQKLGLQGEWKATKESPDFPMFKRLNDEAKFDAERTLDAGDQADVRAEKSAESTVDQALKGDNLRRNFAGAATGKEPEGKPEPSATDEPAPAPQRVAMADQLPSATQFNF